jgi:hypothetical protein
MENEINLTSSNLQIQANILFHLANSYENKFNFTTNPPFDLEELEISPDISLYEKPFFDGNETIFVSPPLCIIQIASSNHIFNDMIINIGKYFDKQVKSCWLVIPMLKNIYVFTNRENYEIYKSPQTLLDMQLDISLNLSEAFK